MRAQLREAETGSITAQKDNFTRKQMAFAVKKYYITHTKIVP